MLVSKAFCISIILAYFHCHTVHGAPFLSEELEALNEKDATLQKCIRQIADFNFKSNDNILYSHWNQNISSSVIDFGRTFQTQVYSSREKPDKVRLNRYDRFTGYVLVTSKNNFSLLMKQVRSMDRWNARATFIILLEGTVTMDIWQVLIGYYATNVLVVQVEDLHVYTYFPYKYENLRQPFLESFPLGTCSDFDMVAGPLALSNKIPKQWRNTTVIVAYMHLHPYILEAEKGTGIEIQLVDLMQGFMKYNVQYSAIHYIDWGFYYRMNGSYSGPVGAIQRYAADFVIGHFHLREPERIIDFDTTFSYMDDDICWTVPRVSMLSHWENIMNIFDKDIWLMTTVALFLSYTMWQLFNWKSPYVLPSAHRYYANPLVSMEVPFLCFLGLPIIHEPKSWAIRFLFLVISIFCFILVTGWKSYLIVSLTHETYGYQIHTLPDIIESGLTIGVYQELIDLHCADGTPEGDFVCSTADRNLCDASHRCLDRTAYKKDMVTIATNRILRYMSPQKYRTATGREMIYVFTQCIAKDYTVQYYTKGHPLFERSNNLLVWLRTSGFVDNLDKRLDHEVELSYQQYVSSLSLFDISVLGLMQMQGMFYLLLGGIALSTLVFIIELFIDKYELQVRKCKIRLESLFRNVLCFNVEQQI